MAIYDQIGTTYNATRNADPLIFSRLKDLLQPTPQGYYLDIGCGTGNYTHEFAKLGYTIAGADPSPIMLAKAKNLNPEIEWVQAPAEALPFNDNTFNGAIATFTVHHWGNMDLGFKELSRVLADGAMMVLLTFAPRQERGYWLNHYFPKMMQNSILRKNSYEAMLQAALQNGFTVHKTEKYFVHDGLTDLFCYAGKNNPEMYFDETIRSGISSFALWPEETAAGLQRLRQDLDSGAFNSIRSQYENEDGDYLFAVLKLKK